MAPDMKPKIAIMAGILVLLLAGAGVFFFVLKKDKGASGTEIAVAPGTGIPPPVTSPGMPPAAMPGLPPSPGAPSSPPAGLPSTPPAMGTPSMPPSAPSLPPSPGAPSPTPGMPPATPPGMPGDTGAPVDMGAPAVPVGVPIPPPPTPITPISVSANVLDPFAGGPLPPKPKPSVPVVVVAPGETAPPPPPPPPPKPPFEWALPGLPANHIWWTPRGEGGIAVASGGGMGMPPAGMPVPDPGMGGLPPAASPAPPPPAAVVAPPAVAPGNGGAAANIDEYEGWLFTGRGRPAIIVTGPDGESRTLGMGDTLAGYRVISITPTQASLVSDATGEERTMRLTTRAGR